MFDMKNMQAVMEQATAMQNKMKDDLDKMAVVGTSAGDGVRLVVNGHKEVTKIEFQPHVLKNPEILADLVLAALHSAYAEVETKTPNPLQAGLQNLDLSSLSGLFNK